MTAQPLPFDLEPPPAKKRRGGVQRTSVLAAMQEHKLLDRRMSDAVRWLSFYTGPAPTSLELAKASHYPLRDWQLHKLNVRIGLSDAKRKGLVANSEKRHCAVSGKLSLTWKVSTR